MMNVEQLEKLLKETEERRYNIINLINCRKKLAKEHSRVNKATEALKDTNLPQRKKEYLVRCLESAGARIPVLEEKIKSYEEKIR